MRKIFHFLGTLCLIGLVSAPASAQYLSEDELTRLMAGTSIETKTRRTSSDFYITFNADGSLEARIVAKRELLDDGKWWMKVSLAGSAMFCHQFDEFGEGRKFCASFTIDSEGLTIVRYKGDGTRREKEWVITKPGPQASVVIAAKKAALVAARDRAAAPAHSRRSPIAPAPPVQQPLTKDELTRLMAGTSIETTNQSDWDFYITFNADGSLEARIDAKRETLDDGEWWTEKAFVNAGIFCHQFDEFGGGNVFCALIGIDYDGRTLARYGWEGLRRKKIWVITNPGLQASAVIAAKKATRIPGQSPEAPPAQRPLTAARDTQPPVIDVPATIAAKGELALITGQIRDISRLIEVTIDGHRITVRSDGSFGVLRGVPQGGSTITISALDAWGNRASRKVTLTREKLAVAPKPRPDPYAGIHFGAYHALVIGNNNYRDLTKLKTAVNDARAVAKLLTDDYGFDTKLLIDATRADVITAMAGMRAKLKANDNLLIYYAGHGVVDTITEQGYWLPVDAEEAVPTNWVSNNDITTMLRAIRAKHIMVVADSCYSGTLVRAAAARMKTSKGRAAWVKRIVKKRGRTALVSGGLEPVTDSGMGGHSVFANAFLAALRENRNVIDGQTLYQTIKRPVVLNANQTPQYSDIRLAGHEGGDFVFVRKR